MKIIATDLDRTLLPNGNHKIDKNAYSIFKKEIKKNNIMLIFVTGRSKKQVKESMKKYDIPKPQYIITDVGTKIYKYENNKMLQMSSWNEVLENDWEKLRGEKINALLSDVDGLQLQEKAKLNDFKQSYYTKILKNPDLLREEIMALLKKNNVPSTVVYSVDVNKGVGLLDVMPKSGNKNAALKFLIKKLKVKKSDVLYSGDSGNDLSLLASDYSGILVKNASDDVKRRLEKYRKEKNAKNEIYIAQGKDGLNGNYVSGIIEGARHFGFFGN
ncbi:MAG: HAD-IIB family hydrolase [Nanoarchaeota archaeon]|nr:HAD-IIB family hydrolase [Nanoarchaeota archaeon]